jgi:hypothetical protein
MIDAGFNNVTDDIYKVRVDIDQEIGEGMCAVYQCLL